MLLPRPDRAPTTPPVRVSDYGRIHLLAPVEPRRTTLSVWFDPPGSARDPLSGRPVRVGTVRLGRVQDPR